MGFRSGPGCLESAASNVHTEGLSKPPRQKGGALTTLLPKFKYFHESMTLAGQAARMGGIEGVGFEGRPLIVQKKGSENRSRTPTGCEKRGSLNDPSPTSVNTVSPNGVALSTGHNPLNFRNSRT